MSIGLQAHTPLPPVKHPRQCVFLSLGIKIFQIHKKELVLDYLGSIFSLNTYQNT